MPIVDNRVVPETPIIPRSIYNIEQVFNPGNAEAPMEWICYKYR